MALYFIAILTSTEVSHEILQYKLWFKEHYGCKVALRSPAHITLIPPFEMREDEEMLFMSKLNDFAIGNTPFELQVKNFSSFPPRVIYADVTEHNELINLKNALQVFMQKEKGIPVNTVYRPFRPHITIANRDIPTAAFNEIWNEFSKKQYDATIPVKGISLMINSTSGWMLRSFSPFIS